MAIKIAGGLAAALEFVLQLGLALLALGHLLARKLSGFLGGDAWQKRRLDIFGDASARDQAAAKKFMSDVEYQDYVLGMKDLSESSYDDSGAPAGWERKDDFVGPSGAHATMFYNTATGEYVLAYRGSAGPDGIMSGSNDAMGDWSNNVRNADDQPTEQFVWATNLAKKMSSDPTYGSNLAYTGHSLGGGLASQASITTGHTATTFNAEGIGNGNYTYALANGGHGASEKQITNFHTPNDPLTNVQSTGSGTVAAGSHVTIATNTPGVGASHGLDTFDFTGFGSKK